MFKRGEGPLVSVLIPSRGRPKSLLEAIDSLYSLAKNTNLIELILKLDSDDKETISVVTSLPLPIKTIISPRGNGYWDMHHWVNDMCAISKGDWLYLFNDDARMTTQDWDQLLLRVQIANAFPGVEDVCLLVSPTIYHPNSHEFMFLRHTTYKILGHWSLSPQNDSWIHAVLSMIRFVFDYPIYVQHEEIDDVTRKGVKAAYGTTCMTLISSEAIRNQIKDALKLQDYIDAKRKIREAQQGTTLEKEGWIR